MKKRVFPVLALLPHLEPGNMQPEMMEVVTLISDFKAKHDVLGDNHLLLMGAIEALIQAAQKEKNTEIAEFAYHLRVHERIEDEGIYPSVVLVGMYLKDTRPN